MAAGDSPAPPSLMSSPACFRELLLLHNRFGTVKVKVEVCGVRNEDTLGRLTATVCTTVVVPVDGVPVDGDDRWRQRQQDLLVLYCTPQRCGSSILRGDRSTEMLLPRSSDDLLHAQWMASSTIVSSYIPPSTCPPGPASLKRSFYVHSSKMFSSRMFT